MGKTNKIGKRTSLENLHTSASLTLSVKRVWFLLWTVNLDETKITMFNKQGTSVKCKNIFPVIQNYLKHA